MASHWPRQTWVWGRRKATLAAPLWRHGTSNLVCQSGPTRYELLSSTIDNKRWESANVYEALWPEPLGEVQQLRSWIGVTFAGAGWCPLQPLQSHWMAAPLHYSSWPWPARRPSPQADQTTFPNRPAEEQLCNGVQFLCTNASLAPKVHTGLPSCQGKEERVCWEVGGWLARIVGKQ